MYIRKDDMKPFEKKIWLASPTMHGDELEYVTEAYETNWMSTVGANINEVERIAAESAEVKYAVALSSCTAALHLCVKLAGERLYGKPAIGHGALEGKKVFCSDVTFDATLNPVVYEGGIPVFIDTERDSWNMNPIALEKAFEIYPEVKLVVSAELYGFSGDIKKIKEICEVHGALLIEDAAEAMGASWDGKQCGSYGDYSAVSYNGNKIITGSSGGCLLTNNIGDANKTRKWSTQARENAAWYQHEEVGYNYRMSNVIAGVVRSLISLLLMIFEWKIVHSRYPDGPQNIYVFTIISSVTVFLYFMSCKGNCILGLIGKDHSSTIYVVHMMVYMTISIATNVLGVNYLFSVIAPIIVFGVSLTYSIIWQRAKRFALRRIP